MPVLAGVTPACTPSALEPGEHGRFRYVAKVKGGAPLRLLPPIADADGNIYTLNGAIDTPETFAFVSRVGGGQTANCSITKGDKFGAHGWVGFAQDRAWYWSGDALVTINRRDCGAVLNRDPGTDADLLFRAVLPWVRDAPSQVSLVAMVENPTDRLPFVVRVDLNANILTSVESFSPSDASNVTVIGVGADREINEGFVLLQYVREGQTVVEGRFYDYAAKLTGTGVIDSEPLPEYGIVGYLQRSSRGLVVGLLNDGALVTFDETGGKIRRVENGMAPVGVHSWDGKLFLVGTQDGRPAIAEIDDAGAVSRSRAWAASERMASELGEALTIIDDRTLPSRSATWSPVRTAIGDFPFLSAHSLTRHAPDTSLWVVAGPQFEFSGGVQTAFAVAPVGVAYP